MKHRFRITETRTLYGTKVYQIEMKGWFFWKKTNGRRYLHKGTAMHEVDKIVAGIVYKKSKKSNPKVIWDKVLTTK